MTQTGSSKALTTTLPSVGDVFKPPFTLDFLCSPSSLSKDRKGLDELAQTRWCQSPFLTQVPLMVDSECRQKLQKSFI